jgi:hypothetical protein
MIATFYSIHVRRKIREWQTELAVKQGDPPQRGEVIEVNIQGEKVKTRVMRITTNMNKAQGQLTLEIHAEEI